MEFVMEPNIHTALTQVLWNKGKHFGVEVDDALEMAKQAEV